MKMIKPLLLSVALMTIIAERGVAADLCDEGIRLEIPDQRGATLTVTSAPIDAIDEFREEGDKITLASLFDETPVEEGAQINYMISFAQGRSDYPIQSRSAADDSKNFISNIKIKNIISGFEKAIGENAEEAAK